MTFVRRLRKKNAVYLYRVTTYREKGTGKVKQKTMYLGKEVTKEGKTMLLPPKHKRIGVKKVLSYGAPAVLYALAEHFKLPGIIDEAVGGYTRIADPGKKLVILAINKVLSNDGITGMDRWFSSTALPHITDVSADAFTAKKVRSLYMIVSLENPDIIRMIEDRITKQIQKTYPADLSLLVYDLTDLTFYGKVNSLAKYGHAYHHNGYEKQINLVLAVTQNGKLPVHHRILPGNIVSVSTIRRFTHELKGLGIKNVVAVLDRGFYSQQNMKEIQSAECTVIGALPATLSIYEKALKRSKNIEHPDHYMKYNDEMFFIMQHELDGKRLIVYHSPEKHTKDLAHLYASIDERKQYLKERENILYDSKEDMTTELTTICKPYQQCFNITPIKTGKKWGFSYQLRPNVIQQQTQQAGKTVLFTTSAIPYQDILKIYREKDVVEKAFCLMKQRGLLPVQATTEETTKANGMLAVLGYLLLALLRKTLEEKKKTDKKTFSLENTLTLLDEIKEVVNADNSTTLTDITKEQENILKKCGVVLK